MQNQNSCINIFLRSFDSHSCFFYISQKQQQLCGVDVRVAAMSVGLYVGLIGAGWSLLFQPHHAVCDCVCVVVLVVDVLCMVLIIDD